MDQPNNELDISSLPPEVMETIFEFLTFKQLLTASVTCRTWYQLVRSPKFFRMMRIIFSSDDDRLGDISNYEKYRHVRVTTDATGGNHSAIAGFLRAAPLESLVIKGKLETISTLLNEHLLSMKQLTELHVLVSYCEAVSESVIRINHASLAAARIDGYVRNANFEINCPNLTELVMKGGTKANSEEAVRLVNQLQQQLQSLNISVHENQQLETLLNTELNNLKKLRLHIHISRVIGLSFNRMLNLVELQLYGSCYHTTIGEELGVLKNLSKLSLIGIDIATTGFEIALHQMEKLKDLSIERCNFESSTNSWKVASENIINLSVVCGDDFPITLPHCKKLKSLYIAIRSDELDTIFVQVCNSYPQLEKLHIDAKLDVLHQDRRTSIKSFWAEFRFSTSILHINNLKLLKELHLTRLILEKVDWTECSTMKIEVLRLDSCEIFGSVFLQLVEVIGPGLQQLILRYCNKCDGSFIITRNFVKSLRKVLPRCRILCDFSEESDGISEDSKDVDLNLSKYMRQVNRYPV